MHVPTGSPRHPLTAELLRLFHDRGGSLYGGEGVTQAEHALHTAWLAEREVAPAALVTAALLNDVGHLLHDLPDDAPERGIDDRHEQLAAAWLRRRFPAAVHEPVRLHVAAKRYLTRVDSAYLALLSGPSLVSLELQGGPMSAAEAADFEASPFWRDAVRLRRWDDAAKDPALAPPPVEHFAAAIDRVLAEHAAAAGREEPAP